MPAGSRVDLLGQSAQLLGQRVDLHGKIGVLLQQVGLILTEFLAVLRRRRLVRLVRPGLRFLGDDDQRAGVLSTAEKTRFSRMNGAGSKPFPCSSPVHELPKNLMTWLASTHARITAELTTRNATVPIPLATASETRSMKLLPPAYGDPPRLPC